MKHTLLSTVAEAGKHTKGLWYLASPYSKYPAGREQAFRDVSRVALELIERGVNVFAPIAHSHPIETAGTATQSPDFWLKLDEQFMKNCVGMIVACLPGWEASYGVNYELRHFAEAEKPIILLDAAPLLEPQAAIVERQDVPPLQMGTLKDQMFGKPETIVMKHTNIKSGSPKVAEVNAKLSAERKARRVQLLASADRKNYPLASGVLDYFPDALMEVAAVSKAGNDKHNPGEPLHHARGKSMDHADCIIRHLKDRGKIDPENGRRHSGETAWRALALLQEEIENDKVAAGAKLEDVVARGAWLDSKAQAHVEGTMDAGIPVDHTGRSPDDRYFD